MLSQQLYLIPLFLSLSIWASPTRLRGPDVSITTERVKRADLPFKRALLEKRADDVNSLSALGDSFSAGPSAGTQRAVDDDDYSCSRYDGAFPQQLNEDSTLPGADRTFQFRACTGAKLPDVINTQLPQLNTDVDMVTMTIGGNDVGFASILNNCVYGFTQSSFQWNCPDTLAWSRTEMEGDTFHANYDSVLQGIWEKSPNAHIFVPSYPAFFNVDTDQCSGTCFTPSILCPSDYYLTKERRTELNDLTAHLNDQVKAAIFRNPPPEGSTGSLQWIDSNPKYDGHRFCEDGVTEPDYNNPNIYFYPFTWTKRDWLSTADLSDCDTLEQDTPYTGDIGHLLECGINGKINEDPSFADALNNNPALESTLYPDEVDVASGSIGTPAFLQRVFHPTVAGMTTFKDGILELYNQPVLNGAPTPADPPPDDPAPEPKTLCGLGNYQDATVGPIGDGIDYLNGKGDEMFCADAKTCSRASCSYGTGMSLCNDTDEQKCTSLSNMGAKVDDAKNTCQIDTSCNDTLLCDIAVQCCSTTVQSFQYFDPEGWNILVQGGFDC